MVPVLGAIVGDVDAAVVAEDQVPAVARVDPQRMMIGMGAAAGVVAERLAAVGGAETRDAADVEVSLIGRINANTAKVHRPRVERVDSRPALAAVGRFVDAAVLETIPALPLLDVG